MLACFYDENALFTTGGGSCRGGGGEGGPRRHLSHQDRSLPAFQGDGSRLLPDRCVWPQTDRIARAQGGGGVGRQALQRVGPGEREPGELGTIRPRLVAGEVQRAPQRAAVCAPDRLQPSLVAGYGWSCFRATRASRDSDGSRHG